MVLSVSPAWFIFLIKISKKFGLMESTQGLSRWFYNQTPVQRPNL